MTSQPMPDLLSAALIARDETVLTAHRKANRSPFAGQWLLPMTPVRKDESAEEAVRRHAREQFGIGLASEIFADTVYLEDPADQHRYVANIFRVTIEGGPMRFNAAGDYDDARWLSAEELPDLWMPPALREPLIRLLTEPDAPIENDWQSLDTELAGQATPLGELAEVAVEEAPPPDNRAAWEAVAKAYQAAYPEHDPARLMWAPGVFDDDVGLLDDSAGRRAIVLGCGGGQDAVALAKQGAIVVGVDQSSAQLAHAKKYALRHDAPNASFVEGVVEDLSRFDDGSFDLALSVGTLEYVERLTEALAEAHRILRQGGTLAIAVAHPFGSTLSDSSPYVLQRGYWARYEDISLPLEGAPDHLLRRWLRTVSEWIDAIIDAGFAIDRVAEPQPADADAPNVEAGRASRIPSVLIIRARKR